MLNQVYIHHKEYNFYKSTNKVTTKFIHIGLSEIYRLSIYHEIHSWFYYGALNLDL